MINAKNKSDAGAIDLLQSLVGPSRNRKVLALSALDHTIHLQTNLGILPANDAVQSAVRGLIDEVLLAVETVLANRD